MTISLNGVGTGTAFVHNYSFNLNSDCGVVITGSKMSIDVLRFFQCCINMHKINLVMDIKQMKQDSTDK